MCFFTLETRNVDCSDWEYWKYSIDIPNMNKALILNSSAIDDNFALIWVMNYGQSDASFFANSFERVYYSNTRQIVSNAILVMFWNWNQEWKVAENSDWEIVV